MSDADFLMVWLAPRSTGLASNIWIGPRGHARHSARIRHGDAVVSVEDNPPEVIEGWLSAADLALVRQYIALNKAAILDHWHERSDGVELARALRSLAAT